MGAKTTLNNHHRLLTERTEQPTENTVQTYQASDETNDEETILVLSTFDMLSNKIEDECDQNPEIICIDDECSFSGQNRYSVTNNNAGLDLAARYSSAIEYSTSATSTASTLKPGLLSTLATASHTLFSFLPRFKSTISQANLAEEEAINADDFSSQATSALEKKHAFDYGSFDANPETDPATQEPIFTYRVYRHGTAVGSMRLYGQPLICTDESQQRNNILSVTGEFSNINLTREMDLPEICRVLPPTFVDKVLISGKSGAVNGALRGTVNAIGLVLQSQGTSKTVAHYISKALYIASFYTMRFSAHSDEIKEATLANYWNATYKAAADTGHFLLTEMVVNTSCQFLQRIGNKLSENGWQKTGASLKNASALAQRFGMFGWNACQKGLLETSVSMAAGSLAQASIEATTSAGINYMNGR